MVLRGGGAAPYERRPCTKAGSVLQVTFYDRSVMLEEKWSHWGGAWASLRPCSGPRGLGYPADKNKKNRTSVPRKAYALEQSS